MSIFLADKEVINAVWNVQRGFNWLEEMYFTMLICDIEVLGLILYSTPALVMSYGDIDMGQHCLR